MSEEKTQNPGKLPVIAVSIGDLNGIGLEVIIKTFSDKRMLDICTPVIYATNPVIAYHKNSIENIRFHYQQVNYPNEVRPGRINLINAWNDRVNLELGKPSSETAKYTLASLQQATETAVSGGVDGIVTAPVNKKLLQSEAFDFPGHTEYIASFFQDSEPLMFFISDTLKLACYTGHLPLKDVSGALNHDRLAKKLTLLHESLEKDFLINKPRIAVLGLNPHAGEEGLLGEEEVEIIQPAIKSLKDNGKFVFGPYPADGFFGTSMYKDFDAVMAMYHDQGLVPFKTLAFEEGVNYTAGLPIVRTSPDHGTAYSIAGQNAADETSFRNAVFTACKIIKNREFHQSATKDPLESRRKKVKEVK